MKIKDSCPCNDHVDVRDNVEVPNCNLTIMVKDTCGNNNSSNLSIYSIKYLMEIKIDHKWMAFVHSCEGLFSSNLVDHMLDCEDIS